MAKERSDFPQIALTIILESPSTKTLLKPSSFGFFLIGLTFGIEGVLQYERSFNSVRVFICMIIMH